VGTDLLYQESEYYSDLLDNTQLLRQYLEEHREYATPQPKFSTIAEYLAEIGEVEDTILDKKSTTVVPSSVQTMSLDIPSEGRVGTKPSFSTEKAISALPNDPSTSFSTSVIPAVVEMDVRDTGATIPHTRKKYGLSLREMMEN
jgi:hypothetical protein